LAWSQKMPPDYLPIIRNERYLLVGVGQHKFSTG
jgi:hypothetical protein